MHGIEIKKFLSFFHFSGPDHQRHGRQAEVLHPIPRHLLRASVPRSNGIPGDRNANDEHDSRRSYRQGTIYKHPFVKIFD